MPPLINLRDVTVTFGGAPLFHHVDLAIKPRDRLCVVGRNGCGKSTLLRVLAGTVEPDAGRRDLAADIRIGFLEQDVGALAETVSEFVAGGLPAEQDRVHLVEVILEPLELSGDRPMAGLSGGELRRAALARALIGEPDVLLLDEPTNHLDIEAIEWLEDYIAGFPGAVVMISHDRMLLRRFARRMAWIDRGVVRTHDAGFDQFEAWSEAVYAEEDSQIRREDQKLIAETRWLHRGITARRRRNMGRLRALERLRADRRARVARQSQAKLELDAGPRGPDTVVVAEGISKRFDGRQVIGGFSTRIVRGDRTAVIGPNGAGKTTLLRMLLGEMTPDTGKVRMAEGVEVVFFDQLRDSLDPKATPWQVLCPQGGDMVDVRGRRQHVVGYLRDFLFAENQARTPITSLSGGERSRLLLARLFARPANLVALDEPTNDLDMETLDLLQDVIAGFEGTLIMVSHDRDFIDRLATSTIVVEPGGALTEYVGGYSDYLRQRGPEVRSVKAATRRKPSVPVEKPSVRQRLSYKEQREFDLLPDQIEQLSDRIETLNARLADADFYAADPDGFGRCSAELGAAKQELETAEMRWLELAEKQETLSTGQAPSGG